MFRIEEILAQLRHIHHRSHSLLFDDDAHLRTSSSSAPAGYPSSSSQIRRRRRPFILHRNQWRCLLDAYSQIFRHIDDVLVRILQSPLEALLSAMESAERSLNECVAPHIYESVNDRSPDMTASSSSAVSTSDPDSPSASDSHGDDEHLTEKQVKDVGLWMMQKALKHGLGSEVQHLHMDDLRTCTIAVLESLTNYSASAEDLAMALDLETWKTADVETGIERGMDLSGSGTTQSYRSTAPNVEDLDLASAQRFFGDQLRRSIIHSPRMRTLAIAPRTLAIAQFVLNRISLSSHIGPNTTMATMMERLKVTPAQFSDMKVEGEKVKIGKGGFSTVLMKKWMLESNLVAMKEVEMHTAASASNSQQEEEYGGMSKMLEGEAATQARLYHPNLLPLLCFTEEARNDYIYVPHLHAALASSGEAYVEGAFDRNYLSGGNTRRIVGLAMELMLYDLHSLIQQRKTIIHARNRQHIIHARNRQQQLPRRQGVALVVPFPLDVTVDIMLQIAKGMEYLHRHRIMHRDLKPANILISPDSVGVPPSLHNGDDGRLVVRVKIADFGVSKALASKYSSHQLTASSVLEAHTPNVGTGVWRAPEVMSLEGGGYNWEQQMQDPRYTKSADVYSFAMVCYEIMTARVPFDGDTSPSLRYKIHKEHYRPGFDESCPAALVDMIQCCWHPDPFQRPDFAQISNFLRYMKMCAVQLVGSSEGDNGNVDKWRKALAQIVRSKKLFSVFRSNDERRGSKRLIEMCMETRRMIVAEMGYSSALAKWAVSSDDESAPSWEAEDDSRGSNSKNSSTVKAPTQGFQLKNVLKDLRLNFGFKNKHLPVEELSINEIEQRAPAIVFKVKELEDATDRFDSRNIIGHGSFGHNVYKGILRNGEVAAIKVMDKEHSRKYFINEVNLLSSSVQHRNLIELVGFTMDDSRCYIVYEYLPNRSLDLHLFGESEEALELNWEARFKIISGITRGLRYLHEESRVRIVHRDVKPSNILLDGNLVPKISEFGLATTLADDESCIEREIAGTVGYLAPETITESIISDKTDVYSLGVTMLAIVSGRRPWDIDAPKSDDKPMQFVRWALELYERERVMEMVDRKVKGSANEGEVKRVVHVALLCTQKNPEARPSVSEVYMMLSSQSAIPDLEDRSTLYI